MTSLETMKRLNKEREAYLRRQRRQHIKGEMKSRGLFVIEGGGENEATYTARGGDGKTHLEVSYRNYVDLDVKRIAPPG